MSVSDSANQPGQQSESSELTPRRFDARGVLRPKRGKDPWAHRRGEPRTFVAAWIGLLTLLVVVTLGGIGVLGLLAHDVYSPAARRLFVLIMLSICLVWPLVRVSQTPPAHPARSFAIDALFLFLPVPVLIAAQSFPWMAGWPVSACVCLAVCFAAWCAFIGAMLAAQFVLAPGRALPALGACLSLTLAGVVIEAALPQLASTQTDASTVVRTLFPTSAVREIIADRAWSGQTALVSHHHWWGVGIVGAAAIVAWGIVGLFSRRQNESGPEETSIPDYHPDP